MLNVRISNVKVTNLGKLPLNCELSATFSVAGCKVTTSSSEVNSLGEAKFQDELLFLFGAEKYEKAIIKCVLNSENSANLSQFRQTEYLQVKDIFPMQSFDSISNLSWNSIIPDIQIKLLDENNESGVVNVFFSGIISVSDEEPDEDQTFESEPLEEVQVDEKVEEVEQEIIEIVTPYEKFTETMHSSYMAQEKKDFLIQVLESSNMKSLTINGADMPNNMRLDDEDIRILTSAIYQSRLPIESLSLPYQRITDVGLKFISQYLIAQNTTQFSDTSKRVMANRFLSLSYLDLTGNNITNVEILKLHSSKINELEYFNISNNELGEIGGLQLATAMSTNRRLKCLVANNCGFNLKSVIGIITSLYGNKVLEELHLNRPLVSRSSIDDESSNHLSRLLMEKSCALSCISMKWSGIGDTGSKLLSTSIKTTNKVSYLDLESNSISVAGAEALASCIIFQERTKSGVNGVGYRGAEKYNNSGNMQFIEVLKLSYNMIGDEGAIALAEAISYSTSLKKLTLNNNGIGVKGLLAIGEALKKSKSLVSISIFGNNFEQKSGELFYKLMKNSLPRGIDIDIDVYIVDGVYHIAKL